MQLDYTWERTEKLIRAEEYEDGVEKGIEKGVDLFYDTLQKLKQGIPPDVVRCLTLFTQKGHPPDVLFVIVVGV